MNYFCKNCGYVGKAIKRKKGSTATGILLFIGGVLTCGLLLIAWFPYEVWRLFHISNACPKCGRFDGLIAEDSPMAQMMLGNINKSAVTNTIAKK